MAEDRENDAYPRSVLRGFAQAESRVLPFFLFRPPRAVPSSRMKSDLDPLAADHQFFTAMVQGDLAVLDEILADDFVLIEVMKGSEVSKSDLLEVLRSGQLKFQTIEPFDNRVRLYQTAAVVTGRTKMSGRFGETPFSTSSRYTHVYVRQPDRWRMVSAQGTPISS